MPDKETVSVYYQSTGPLKLQYEGENMKNCVAEAPALIPRAFMTAYNNPESGTDVQFVIQLRHPEKESEFKVVTVFAHSIVLRQRSPVMSEILDSTSNWNFNVEELFPGMNGYCFIQLLKYMYKGKLRFPSAKLQIELLNAATTLKMDECQNAIRAWFATYLKPLEALQIAPIALRKGYYQAFDICCTIVSTVASSLLEDAPHILLNCELPMLVHFVKSTSYDVSEDALFKLVAQYCDRNAEKYGVDPMTFFKTHFEKLIRYPLMSAEELYKNFTKTTAFNGWVDRQYILEAYKYNALGRTQRDGFFSVRMIPREGLSSIPRKWDAPDLCKGFLKFEKSRVTKVSGGNTWNCVAYIPIKKSCRISVKIEDTNSDRSGLSVGIGGKNLINECGMYSSVVSTQYNRPVNCKLGNPPVGSVITFVISHAQDTITVFENGKDCGIAPSKPSFLGQELVLIAFLYYVGNSVSIVKS